MAELIAGLIEAFVSLIAAFIRILIYGAIACVTIVAYLISSKFRSQKQQEWRARPVRKYLDVAFSTTALAGLVALSVWLASPEKPKPGTMDHFEVQNGESSEDMRFVVGTDKTNRWRFAVTRAESQTYSARKHYAS